MTPDRASSVTRPSVLGIEKHKRLLGPLVRAATALVVPKRQKFDLFWLQDAGTEIYLDLSRSLVLRINLVADSRRGRSYPWGEIAINIEDWLMHSDTLLSWNDLQPLKDVKVYLLA